MCIHKIHIVDHFVNFKCVIVRPENSYGTFVRNMERFETFTHFVKSNSYNLHKTSNKKEKQCK